METVPTSNKLSKTKKSLKNTISSLTKMFTSKPQTIRNSPTLNYEESKKINKDLEKYNKSGLEKISSFCTLAMSETMFYLYLFKKYKTNCFLYEEFMDTQNYFGLSIKIQETYSAADNIEMDTYFDTVARQFVDCIKRGTEILIIPIKIRFIAYEEDSSAHANLLIYRKNLNQIEHFEPHGSYLHDESVDKYLMINIRSKITFLLEKFVSNVNKYLGDPPIQFIRSHIVCPSVQGFQFREEKYSNLIKTADEPIGYCVLWSMFFTELCLKNPTIPSRTLLKYIFDKLNAMSRVEQGNYLKNIIRGYSNLVNKKIKKYFTMFNRGKEVTAKTIDEMYDDGLIFDYMQQAIQKYIDLELQLITNETNKEEIQNKMNELEKDVLKYHQKHLTNRSKILVDEHQQYPEKMDQLLFLKTHNRFNNLMSLTPQSNEFYTPKSNILRSNEFYTPKSYTPRSSKKSKKHSSPSYSKKHSSKKHSVKNSHTLKANKK